MLKIWYRSLKFVIPHWRLASISVALIVVGAFAGLLQPWPLKILVDSVLGNHPAPHFLYRLGSLAAHGRTGLLVVVVVSTVLLTIFVNGLSVIDNYVNTKIHQWIVLDFRSQLFQHAQRLTMTFHDQGRAGMIIYAINFQADAAAQLIMAIPPLAQSLITLVGMFWITYTLDHTLALLALTVIPFLYYSVGYYIKHIQGRLYNVKMMEGETLSIIHEAISMLRVIVAFGREDHEYKKFRDQGERALSARVRLTVQQTLFSLAVNTTTAIGTALVLGFGGYHALTGHITIGQLLVIIAYIASVYKPLETISTTIGSLQDQLISVRLAFELADIVPEIQDAPNAITLGRCRGHVTFENVSFTYSSRTSTLDNVSFDAKPGQVIAIVGPTGAGKTTTISMIPRFHEAQQGRILLDGHDIRLATLKSLRDQVSIVLQEPLLFSGTIAENIRYGRLDATDEEIIEAAEGANAHDFIMNLPLKYETQIGERGAQLSGGERQRISIARAFLKDAPILILDEPTSSIDSKTESVILDALDRLMAGRTTFMVAHRLSTVRHADQIIVLRHGQVVEKGSHEDLIAKEGLYRQLHDMQTAQVRRRRRVGSTSLEAVETT